MEAGFIRMDPVGCLSVKIDRAHGVLCGWFCVGVEVVISNRYFRVGHAILGNFIVGNQRILLRRFPAQRHAFSAKPFRRLAGERGRRRGELVDGTRAGAIRKVDVQHLAGRDVFHKYAFVHPLRARLRLRRTAAQPGLNQVLPLRT